MFSPKLRDTTAHSAPQPLRNRGERATGTGESEAFEKKLRGILRDSLPKVPGGSVSEEELFTAVLIERVYTKHGAIVGTAYDRQVQSEISSAMDRGRLSYEAAANRAMRRVVHAGGLEAETARGLKQEAFDAAQLDKDRTRLYDRIGGNGDPTVSVAPQGKALRKAGRRVLGGIVA